MYLQWEPLRSSFQLLHTCARWCWCVHLMGWTRLLPLLHHSSLFSDTLACCLFAFSLSPSFQVSIYPSLPPSLRVSIPPTLSCWPLPARSPQGKLPELGYSVRLHCNAPLWPAIQHTHMDTQIQCRHGPKQAWHSNYIGILLWNVCLVQSKGVFHHAGSFPGLRITTSLVLM